MLKAAWVLFGILVIQSLAHPVASVTPDWASKGCPDAIRCPEPDKGTKLSTCMIHMVEVVGTSNCSVDLPGNFTLVPNATVLREISQLAEVMACQMSDAQVDLYCQAAYDPLLEQAIKGRLHIRKGHPTGQHIRAHPSEFKDPFQTDGVNLNPNPFQKDGQSGLFLPHEAEYALTAESNSYNLIMGSLRILPGPVIDDPSGRSRTNLEPVAAATVSCVGLRIATAIADTVCEALAIVPIVGENLSAGCKTFTGITKTSIEACVTVTEYAAFIDGNVDSSELQAAFENGKKALENQLVLWNKMNRDTNEVKALITQTSNEIKALITQTSNEIKDLIGQSTQLIVNTIGELSRKLDDTVETLATQNCDVKNQIADVQREVNYIRFLSVTPADERPRLGASTAECSVSVPEYCPRASTEKPRRPIAFSQPEACLVSDGARRFEFGEEGSL